MTSDTVQELIAQLGLEIPKLEASRFMAADIEKAAGLTDGGVIAAAAGKTQLLRLGPAA